MNYNLSIDMHWHWIQEQIALKRFRDFFKPNQKNNVGNFTKLHAPAHNREVRLCYLHQINGYASLC